MNPVEPLPPSGGRARGMAEATTPPPPSDRAATGKRERTTPTGQTPQRPKKRVPLREKDRTIGYVSSAGTRLPLFSPATPGNWSASLHSLRVTDTTWKLGILCSNTLPTSSTAISVNPSSTIPRTAALPTFARTEL